MKQKTLQKHLEEIASKGGKATFKNRGRKHYIKMAKTRWANKVTK